MHKGRWYEGIKPEDLPGDLSDIANTLGMDVAVRVAESFGGGHLYIPQAVSVMSKAKKRFIVENRHLKPRELGRLTGYSERQVYRILEEVKDSQAALFSDE